MNRLRFILLTILLAVAYVAAGQRYVIDSVCRGAERHYRIDGETGSTYTWTLTDPSGNTVTLPETADTVTIIFNVAAGDYTLSTLQTSIHGCDSLELGTIKVFDLPLAYAGAGMVRCNNNPVTLSGATATGYSSLLWISNGDGKFNDSTSLHPEYTFGPADLKIGSVTFTLKASGFGSEGSCPPVESSVTIQIKDEIIPSFDQPGPLCLNSTPPALPAVSTNGISGKWIPAVITTSVTGTSIYTFMPDPGQCGLVTTLSIKVESPEITDVIAYPSTNGLANGYAVITAGHEASQDAYSLNGIDWQTSNTFRKLSVGNYTAWVRNENGCVVTMPFNILNTVVGQVNLLAGSSLNCITVPVQVPMKATGFKQVASFTVQLAFDPAILTFNGYSNLNTLLATGTLSTTMISAGVLEINFIARDTLTLVNQDNLMSLNFVGTSAGKSALKWDALKCTIYSASGYEIPAIYTQGSVDIRPLPQVYTAGNGAYCESSPHKLVAGSLTGESLGYSWTNPLGETHEGAEWDLGQLSSRDAGEYVVRASDGGTCEVSQSVNLVVYPNPHVSLNMQDTLCTDKEVMLNAGAGFASYTWQDGSAEPQYLATSEGLYWVTVTDNNGCQASDSVLLKQCELLIVMPNVFSPNGDGVNDEFLPRYNPDMPVTFQMYIFNKWGEQVFSTSDISKGWDGRYKGAECPQDMYTWTIIFSAPENYKFMQKSPQSGNVMLLK